MTTYPVDLDSINYEAVWDSLGLGGQDRKIAGAIINGYQADPDLKHSSSKSRENLDDIARRSAELSERIFRSFMGKKDIPKSIVVDILIDSEVLARINSNGHPVYRLNPEVLKKLERRY